MLKQSDAMIILAVLAAVVGVFILSSDTASLVVVAALAMVFGGLIGTRWRISRSNVQDPEQGLEQDPEQDGKAGNAPGEDHPLHRDVPAGTISERGPGSGGGVGGNQADEAMSSAATKTAAKPKAAGEIDAPSQIALLKNLVASVSEGIAFKDPQGRYISANAAFAQMLGSRTSEIVGRDDTGVFGHLTAKSLMASDDAATEKGRTSTTLEVPLPDGPRYFEITKASVSNDDDSLEGIVAVWRDVTEPALGRRAREKAMRETIKAFTKSIEFRDAYLGDHAQRLAHLATAVCDAMELDENLRTTTELAAHLSQIGKLAIDAQLLGRQRRFTEPEINEVQKHVHHTARLLRNLDFGLPVAATLFQIHERLDGTGYPQGLGSAEIALPARILGACDTFCARTSPRSYRPAITPEAALEILLQNSHRYDETVVHALQQVVGSPESAKIVA